MNRTPRIQTPSAPASQRTAPVASAAAPAKPRPYERGEIWRALFGIDLRSLALFRISLALMLLADLYMRTFDIEAFYTDFGVMPRGAPLRLNWGAEHFLCFHTITGSVTGVEVLFAINAVFVLLLLIGWNTRILTAICFLFLISLQTRNQLVLQGGDVLLRCMMFWGLFLPLGDYLSVDARHIKLPRLPGDDPDRPVRAFSVATIGAIVQMSCLYLFTALLKSDPAWWQTGYAVYLALNYEMLAKPLGRFVAQIPILTYGLTFITIWIEAFGPFAAFLPFWNGPIRTATVFFFWFFHLVALQSMMYIGPFPYICALGWMLFLPPWFWDTLGKYWSKGRESGLRKRLSAWARPWLPQVVLADTPAVSGATVARPFYIGLPIAFQVVAGFYIIVTILWNIRTVNFRLGQRFFPPAWNIVAEAPRMDQSWGMFSPRPPTDGGWFVIEGHLRDGTTLDFMPYLAEAGGPTPISWEKPKEIGEQFRDERWRKYFMNMWPAVDQQYRPFLAAYIGRRWNRDHKGPKELCTFDIIYMEVDTPSQYTEPTPPHAVTLWKQWCFPEFAPKTVAPAVAYPPGTVTKMPALIEEKH